MSPAVNSGLAGVHAQALRRGLLAAAHGIRRGNLGHHLTLLARRATVAGAGIEFPEGPATARSAVTDLEPQRSRSACAAARPFFVRLPRGADLVVKLYVGSRIDSRRGER